MKITVLAFASLCGFAAKSQNVGIGTESPTNRLHVVNSANPLRLEGLAGGAGTDSILTADGSGVVKRRTVASVLSGSAGWSITGNSGVNSNTGFLGTLDASALVFRTFNQRSGFLDFDAAKRNNSFGNRAIEAITTGSGNNAFGFHAMRNINTGTNNVAFGDSAAYTITSGSNNVAIGDDAGRSIGIGSQNIAIGSGTLSGEGAGSNNIGIGFRSLETVVGSENVAIGSLALGRAVSTSNSLAIGSGTLGNYNGANLNFAIGNEALAATTTGYENLAYGYRAGFTTTGSLQNTLIGHYAFGNVNPANTASYNTMLGYQAGASMTGGSNNVALGFNAAGTLGTGSNNTFVGYNADAASSLTAVSNSAAFGYQATVSANNQYRFGNTAVTSIGGQVGWSTLSDERVKMNIHNDVRGLSFIEKLNPVSYNYDLNKIDRLQHNGRTTADFTTSKNSSTRFSGFLAQDVEKAAKESGYEFSGVDKPETADGLYALRYSEFVVPLVKAVQELKTIVDKQQQQIKELQQKLLEK